MKQPKFKIGDRVIIPQRGKLKGIIAEVKYQPDQVLTAIVCLPNGRMETALTKVAETYHYKLVGSRTPVHAFEENTLKLDEQ